MKTGFSLFLFLLTLLSQSCVTTARMSDFSTSPGKEDFNVFSNSKRTDTNSNRNLKTGYEYYIESKITNDTVVIQAITNTLKKQGFKIKTVDKNRCAIIAKRGLRANEWKTIAGIYYQIENGITKIYIRSKITEDFTGGWRANRSEKIGQEICKNIDCIKSYAINTTPKRSL